MSKFIPNKGLYFYYEPLKKTKSVTGTPLDNPFFRAVLVGSVFNPSDRQQEPNTKFFLCTGSDDYAISYKPARASKNKDVPKLLIIRDNNFFPVGPDIIKAFESDLLDIDTAVKPKEEIPGRGFHNSEIQPFVTAGIMKAFESPNVMSDNFIHDYLNSDNKENGNQL